MLLFKDRNAPQPLYVLGGKVVLLGTLNEKAEVLTRGAIPTTRVRGDVHKSPLRGAIRKKDIHLLTLISTRGRSLKLV